MIVSMHRNFLSTGTVVLLLLLISSGVTSVALADEKQSYIYLGLNDDEATVRPGEKNSNTDEKVTTISSRQDDGRDCNALAYDVTLFNPCEGEDSKRLWRQTKIMFVAGFGVAGFIALLPEEISKWDKSEYQRGDLFNNWYENVKAGPVWDNDKWYINLIGHPYFGGVYYQAARKSGYNQWNSFVYTTLMSTFYWEYGLEAFAEVPSLQDLFVTPIGGWIYGEWAHHKEKAIIANGSLAMGSQFWGSVALFLLDPVGKLDDWCCVSKKVEVVAFNIAHWPAQQHSQDINAGKDYWGLKLAIEF
jgi:hypothetical protein